MGDEHTVRTSDAPDEVQSRVIVAPLLLSAFLVAVVLIYRCRAHRLRRDRLAHEREAELQEIAAARDMETGEGRSPGRNASLVGLGSDQYMSAYKKLLAQA
eukprot:g12784.t1